MIRNHLLIVTLVTLCSGAHANIAKDTSRVAVGAGIGAAGFAALQATFNAAMAFVYQDSKLFPGIDYRLVRLSAVIGGTVGLWKTTYARTLRAQWNIWWSRSSKEFIALTMNDYESDAQLVNALERYCVGHTYPLVAAKRELSYILAHINDAACLIEETLEDIADDSLRAEELNDWLDEIYTMRAHIAYAVNAIDKDPRILTLMDAQNRIDQTAALWADAVAHAAVATTSRNINIEATATATTTVIR
jgi:hypothetical protein